MQVEHERIKEAYSSMAHSLETAASEKRALEHRLSQAQANTAREARERRCHSSALQATSALTFDSRDEAVPLSL